MLAAMTVLGWNSNEWTLFFTALASLGSLATAAGAWFGYKAYTSALASGEKAGTDNAKTHALLTQIAEVQRIELDEASTVEEVQSTEQKKLQLNEDIDTAVARWTIPDISGFVVPDLSRFKFAMPDLTRFTEHFAEVGPRIEAARWRDARDEFKDLPIGELLALVDAGVDVWQPDLNDAERAAWERFYNSDPNWLMLHPLDVGRFEKFVQVCTDSGRTEPPGFTALLEDHIDAEVLPGVVRELAERYEESAQRT